MHFSSLQEGRLLRRYKRFLADVELPNGDQLTVHCPNTGAMTACAEPGSRVWLSWSDNPQRKYPYTWELVETATGDMACIHSARANALALEALQDGVVRELAGFDKVYKEAPYGLENSRADLLLDFHGQRCFVEVKSVTLHTEGGIGRFPDAVSQRASKHLRELIRVRQDGDRAVLLFCVLHSAISEVRPADNIDAVYADTLRQAVASGVEVLAYRASISRHEIFLVEALPFILNDCQSLPDYSR